MFVSFNANVLSLLKAVQQSFVYSYEETIDSNFCHFSFIVTSIYSLCYASQDFWLSTQVPALAREKTSEMSRLGAGKCPHFRNSESP